MGRRPTTECPRGHPYDDENTYRGPNGLKYCRICHRDDERARYDASHPGAAERRREREDARG